MAIVIKLSKNQFIYDYELKITATRAQGPGGQHVNKTSTAILLQFDVTASTLNDESNPHSAPKYKF